MPGIAASTSETCELGSPPNAVEAAENSLEREVTWAWTSRPTITSQSPVAPLMSFALALSAAMWIALLSSEVRRDLSAGALCPPQLRKRHPAGRLLNRLAEREERLLVERTPDELQRERQAPTPGRGLPPKKPAGAPSPGTPAMLTVTVKMSLRYISTGLSEPFSPIPKAADGVAGVRIASTPSVNTRSKSRLMRVRIFCALT